MKMAFLSVFLPLIWSCSGCGKPEIDRAFDPYIETIRQEAGVRGKPLKIDFSIKFKELNNGHGVCKKNIFSRQVNIDGSYWNSISHIEKEYLLAHELGHCELNRQHLEGAIHLNGVYMVKSIMNPHSDWASARDNVAREYYFGELFK